MLLLRLITNGMMEGNVLQYFLFPCKLPCSWDWSTVNLSVSVKRRLPGLIKEKMLIILGRQLNIFLISHSFCGIHTDDIFLGTSLSSHNTSKQSNGSEW